MNTTIPYLDLLLLTTIVVYVVDLSGFTQSWKGALSKWLKVKAVSFKPFDCSLCMTWWSCIVYALCTGAFSLPCLAYIAALSFLAFPIGQILIFMREGLLSLINKLMSLYE